MTRRHFSDAVIRKVSDADFETVMRSVNFKETPREAVTVRSMESHYLRALASGTEDAIYR